jgi:hypothetical protein
MRLQVEPLVGSPAIGPSLSRRDEQALKSKSVRRSPATEEADPIATPDIKIEASDSRQRHLPEERGGSGLGGAYSGRS